MKLQSELKNKFLQIFSLKYSFKSTLILNFFILLFLSDISKAEQIFVNENKKQITSTYLDSRDELEDYIIDTGDSLFIEFFPVIEFSDSYPVNSQGEIILPRLEETYVRGLTTSELSKLLEKEYLDYLIEPKITVRVIRFKRLRVGVSGEIRNPGIYKFPSYELPLPLKFRERNKDDSPLERIKNPIKLSQENIPLLEVADDGNLNSRFINKDFVIKRKDENIITISKAIRLAGGITSKSDLSKIEVIRDIPIGKGGGKKRALIDFTEFLNTSDPSNDIRLFDGDQIIVPSSTTLSNDQIPKSILTGLSPRFISVNIFGRVETPGEVKLPLEATLSDAIDLTGPIKPLSGKIVLIRYKKDGTVLKLNVPYHRNSQRGSTKNPFVKEGDLISVKGSFLGKTTTVIKEITAPFIGINATKNLIEDLSN